MHDARYIGLPGTLRHLLRLSRRNPLCKFAPAKVHICSLPWRAFFIFSMKSCYNRWTCRSHYLLNIFWHYAPIEFQTKPSLVCQACRSCLTSGHSFADVLSPICFNVWCILFVRLVCCVRFAQYRAGRVRVSDYTVIWRR